MPIPPLRLEHYFFEEISVATSLDESSLEAVPDDAVHAEAEFLANCEEPSLFQVVLRVSTSPKAKNLPYAVTLKARGLFKITDPQIAQKERDALITNGAAAILYGAARELLVSLTSRGPARPFILPSWFFKPQQLERAQTAKSGKKPARKAPVRGSKAK
jgi:preprotein translocase subunit SecB